MNFTVDFNIQRHEWRNWF